jgi:glutamate 5-kinase
VEISVAAHDTTGGMETKILEAAVIARLGIDVYITKVGNAGNCCLSVKTEKLKIHSKLFWNGRDPKYFRFLWRYRLEQSTRRGL